MRNHPDIIRDAGGPSIVAVQTGVSIHTARGWLVRKSIPAEHWRTFDRLKWATAAELALSKPARKRGASQGAEANP